MADPHFQLINQDSLSSTSGFRLLDLHQDQDLIIKLLVASDINQDDITLDAPALKCYQPTDQDQPLGSWKNRKHRMMWHMVQPLALLYPRIQLRPDEMYDFCVNGYIGHGGSLSNEHTQAIAPVRLRKNRPDLERFFRHPVLIPLFEKTPALGFRFSPAEFRHARNASWIKFISSAMPLRDEIAMHLFTCACMFDVTRLANLKDDRGHTNQIPYFLARDLLAAFDTLLVKIETSLTDDQYDTQGDRLQTICDIVNTLLTDTSTHRMIIKLFPTQVNVVMALIQQYIVRDISSRLDQAILDTK